MTSAGKINEVIGRSIEATGYITEIKNGNYENYDKCMALINMMTASHIETLNKLNAQSEKKKRIELMDFMTNKKEKKHGLGVRA